MSKTNAERQHDFRLRRKERLAARVAATRPPEEAELLQQLLARLPGATASEGGGSGIGTAARGAAASTELTRAWVLDQLRIFALEPARGTPAAIQALKVLLQEIPRGNSLSSVEHQGVRNEVRYARPEAEEEDEAEDEAEEEADDAEEAT